MYRSLAECQRQFQKLERTDINRFNLSASSELSWVYKMSTLQEPMYKIAVLGCQGSNGTAKLKVAKSISEFKPDLMIGLGDNFYPDGVLDEEDISFYTHFHYFYSRDVLKKIPFFAVLGNHDLNLQYKMIRWYYEALGENPYNRMMAQVLHTHLSTNINWCLPHPYYALDLPYANIFFLHSNFLAFEEEQQEWLTTTYRALNHGRKKWNIVAMHHPLNSPGKRFLERNIPDLDQYRVPEFATQIRALRTQNVHCINNALFNYFVQLREKENINFELFLSAHDHLLASMWQREALPQSWQIISGAAGAEGGLQDPEIPSRLLIEKLTSGKNYVTEKDFIVKKNGHVNLVVYDMNRIEIRFMDVNNAVICERSLTRHENGTIAHLIPW